MEIYNATGVTKTGELRVQKSVHALLLASTVAFDSLTGNELISLWVERPSGTNVEIATKIPVKDFVIGSTYGAEAIQSTGTFAFEAICEIADGEGAFMLKEGESLKISLEGITSAATWAINGLEDPLTTLFVKKFERKTVASEDYSKKIACGGYDLAIINDAASSIQDINVKFAVNGNVVKYLPRELRAMARDIDPVAYIKANGNVLQELDRLVIPLADGIEELEINKTTGSIVTVVLMNENFAG